MKKYIIVLLVVLLWSCDTDEQYEDLNRDPNYPTKVTADALFTSSTKSLFDQMESTNVNTNIFRLFSQYWTEVTYVDESNYDLITRKIPDNHWSEMYRNVLYDLQDSKKLVLGDAGKTAMITVLEVYTWQQLVDTFGDIPYTDALKGKDDPTPSYDNDTNIYNNLLIKINGAITQLNSSSAGFTSADIIYNGDISKWKKFANSLKFKIAMRIADVNNSAAQAAAQEAVAAGVLSSNADNTKLQYQAAEPNTNPLWIDLVRSGRSDFVPANTIVDYMNTLNDPRRPFYFDTNKGPGVFIGATYGAVNVFSNSSRIGSLMYTKTFRGVLMEYSEIEFLLAEASERGYTVGGTAQIHYNNAITANMSDWGVSSTDITTYLSTPAVAYTTAVGTWKQKIGLQFWLAMYNRGFEGYCVYRKYDAPVLNIAAGAGTPVPTRYTYPLAEQTLNLTNWTAATTAIGGDLKTTKVFWDVF